MIGHAYADVLDENHKEALRGATMILIDEFYQDIADLLSSPDYPFDQTSMSYYLPRRYLPRYTPLFAKRFLSSFLTVAWKLNQEEQIPLSCVVEELAAHALIDRATALLETEELQADFGGFEDELFEDLDFEWLFDESQDGIDESETGRELGMTPLRFSDWFAPFSPPRPQVHPYVEEE